MIQDFDSQRWAPAALLIGVLLAASLSVAGQDQSKGALLGDVTGRITIHGQPASDLVVELMPNKVPHIKDPAIAKASTDSEGHYEFNSVAPGYYWVKVDAPGLVTEPWDMDGPGRRVAVGTGVRVHDVDIALGRGGAMSGRIQDQAGNPVAGERVELIHPIDVYYAAEGIYLKGVDSKTDELGRFRIVGIPLGRYWLAVGEDIARLNGEVHYKNDSFAGSRRVSRDRYYERRFYPGTTERKQAQVFEVSEGGEIDNLDMTIGIGLRAYAVSGRVTGANGEPVTECYLQLGPKGGGGGSYKLNGPSDTDRDGRFRFTGLMSGRFTIRALLPAGSNLFSKPVEFEVTDSDISDLRLSAGRGLTLSGSVTIEEGAGEDAAKMLTGLKVACTLDDKWYGPARESAVAPDGTFTISGLVPGDVWIFPVVNDQYLKVLRIEYREVGASEPRIAKPDSKVGRGAAPLELLETGMNAVKVVVAYRNTRIRCHVNVVGGKLPADIGAALSVSRTKSGGGVWVTQPQLDPDGNVMLDGLEPGEYELCIRTYQKYLYQTKRTIKLEANKETRVAFEVKLDDLR